ncbi:MAG: hypothetical protein IMZ71_02605 [Chloroflexi bacterium]|nr:hypothetical protein [Chloroflexota bacterium]
MKILPIVEGYLLDEEHRMRQSHYASDANACRRQLWYSWKNAEQSNPPTAGALLKMKMGSAIEFIVEQALKWGMEKGMISDYVEQAYVDVNLGLKYPLHMRCDFLVVPAGSADGQEIIEVKSSFGRGIVEIQRTGTPKEDNLVQCFLYLLHKAPRVTLVYFGRDNGYRTEFQLGLEEAGIDADQNTWKTLTVNGKVWDPEKYRMSAIREKFAGIERMIEMDETPERDYIVAIKNGAIAEQANGSNEYTYQKVRYKGDWQCNYCRWRDRCWAEALPIYAEGNNSAMFEARKNAGKGEDEDADA